MAESRNHSQANGSTLVLGVVVGAMAGASGLAWWFLKETERRRQLQSVLQRTTRAELALKSDSTMPFDQPRVTMGPSHPSRTPPFKIGCSS